MVLSGLVLSEWTYARNDFYATSYARESEGEYQQAIKAMLDNYDENDYLINLRLGWLNYLNGFFTESITYYQRALSLSPLSIEARLGIVLPLAGQGEWNKIATNYREILKLDPHHYTANYRLAAIHYGREQYREAAAILSPLINHYPADYDTVLLSAWNELALGKKSNARLLFQRALELSPEDASALEGQELTR